ncbi:hypothetical protein Tco_0755126 [Tanacetum coccineum]
MWIMASRNGRLTWICLKIDGSRSSSSSFFCFINLEGKGTLDDLEGCTWWVTRGFPHLGRCLAPRHRIIPLYGRWLLVVIELEKEGHGFGKLIVHFLAMLVKHFPYSFSVEFVLEHKAGEVILKLTSDDPFRKCSWAVMGRPTSRLDTGRILLSGFQPSSSVRELKWK